MPAWDDRAIMLSPLFNRACLSNVIDAPVVAVAVVATIKVMYLKKMFLTIMRSNHMLDVNTAATLLKILAGAQGDSGLSHPDIQLNQALAALLTESVWGDRSRRDSSSRVKGALRSDTIRNDQLCESVAFFRDRDGEDAITPDIAARFVMASPSTVTRALHSRELMLTNSCQRRRPVGITLNSVMAWCNDRARGLPRDPTDRETSGLWRLLHSDDSDMMKSFPKQRRRGYADELADILTPVWWPSPSGLRTAMSGLSPGEIRLLRSWIVAVQRQQNRSGSAAQGPRNLTSMLWAFNLRDGEQTATEIWHVIAPDPTVCTQCGGRGRVQSVPGRRGATSELVPFDPKKHDLTEDGRDFDHYQLFSTYGDDDQGASDQAATESFSYRCVGCGLDYTVNAQDFAAAGMALQTQLRHLAATAGDMQVDETQLQSFGKDVMKRRVLQPDKVSYVELGEALGDVGRSTAHNSWKAAQKRHGVDRWEAFVRRFTSVFFRCRLWCYLLPWQGFPATISAICNEEFQIVNPMSPIQDNKSRWPFEIPDVTGKIGPVEF
jgi:hypothetical protein